MSNYFNMGKLAVEKGPKIVRKVKQAIQTTKSPIKQAVETIKATFAKPKKPKIGGTRKSDQIKKSNRMIKDLDKTMEKDMSPELRAKGEKLKKEIKKTQKEVYRTGFKLGKKVEKKKKNGKKFPDLTGDGKVTFADILKGRGVINGKKKNKKKVI
jgi:hypothetical protein